jgi:hypothetical protein
MHVGTVVSEHYLAHARTLAASLRRHNPEVGFTALVVGGGATDRAEPFAMINEHDVGVDDLARRRRAYDDFEYALSFKPALLEWLLERDETALYLDADSYVVGSVAELPETLASADFGLTPHLAAPLPDDGLQPSAVNLLRSGTFNAGFVAARRTDGAAAFLRWWGERLVDGCRNDLAAGYFVDQRWLDFAPSLFPGLRILRERGWNLGHWNLSGEELTRCAGGWRIGPGPVRTCHFSGFDPEAPQRLSKHQNRIVVRRDTPLAELCQTYATELLANGYRDVAGGSSENTYYGRSLSQRFLLPMSRWRALLVARLRRR